MSSVSKFLLRPLIGASLLFFCLSPRLALAQMMMPPHGPGGPDAGLAGPDGGASPALVAVAGHVMVEGSPDAVRVTEVYVLNVGEQVEPSTEGEPWISLPEGASSLTIERGEEMVQPLASGLRLTQGFPPGRHPLAFSFVLPAEEGRAVINHELPFGVEGLHVMWAAGTGFSAHAMGFEDREVVEMGPRRMRILERPEFEAGDRLVIVTSMDGEEMQTGGATPRSMSSPQPEQRDPLGPELRLFSMVLSLLLLIAGALLPFGTLLGRSEG